LVELDVNDIERSDVVKKVIDIYNYKTPDVERIQTIETQFKTHSVINYNYTRINYTNSNYVNNDAALIPKYLEKFLD
jgi:hypothetical protein